MIGKPDRTGRLGIDATNHEWRTQYSGIRLPVSFQPITRKTLNIKRATLNQLT